MRLHTSIAVPLLLYASCSSGLAIPAVGTARPQAVALGGEQRGCAVKRGEPGAEAAC